MPANVIDDLDAETAEQEPHRLDVDLGELPKLPNVTATTSAATTTVTPR